MAASSLVKQPTRRVIRLHRIFSQVRVGPSKADAPVYINLVQVLRLVFSKITEEMFN